MHTEQDEVKTIKSSREVVETDLDYICDSLKDEFESLAGNNLLITGGAGFLGYYLVQAALHWNEKTTGKNRINVTVCDNYIRGVPTWLTDLSDNENLTLIRHDMTQPLPSDLGNFEYVIHAASIASPTYYRKYP